MYWSHPFIMTQIRALSLMETGSLNTTSCFAKGYNIATCMII